ncbi:MAG: helix-turn-helix domain-containing protein [Ignavibacteria bacterium]|nr:helix-turn-helix domain-containing protein [Ignavibacteria bacterium]
MLEAIFGDVLKELRTARKISQEKLAEYCELDRTYISLLERGLRQPTLITLFKISKALDITPSELIKKVEVKIKPVLK